MNRQAILKGSAHFSAPLVLVVGGSLATLAIMGAGPGRPIAATPTVTATVTAPAPVAARTTTAAGPGATPTPHAVVPVSDRTAVLPHTSSGGLSHGQARPPSAPKPTPTSQVPPAGSSCTIGLTVLALNACIGGSR